MISSRHLTPIPRTSLTEEIIKRLINLILDEGLKPGDKLPSERELIAQFSVGRSSLREAVKILSAIGVVEVSVGEGMFIGRGDLSLIVKPLSLGLLMGERSTAELIEAPRLVEVEMAGLAAERAGAEEVAAIGESLKTMRVSQNDPARYSQADVAFHLAVARGARNSVLYHVLETLQHIIHAWIVKNIEGYKGKPGSFHEHVPTYRAIRARDKGAARDAMSAHLGSAGARLRVVVSTGYSPRAAMKGSRRRAVSPARPGRPGSGARPKRIASGALC